MKKLYVNGRDELFVLSLDKVACFKADVDYTIVYYVSGLTATLPIGLNKVESLLTDIPKTPICEFIRVGRSYIVNQAYLYQIQILRQKLILSDGQRLVTLSVSKEALKRFKQRIAEKSGLPKKTISSP